MKPKTTSATLREAIGLKAGILCLCVQAEYRPTIITMQWLPASRCRHLGMGIMTLAFVSFGWVGCTCSPLPGFHSISTSLNSDSSRTTNVGNGDHATNGTAGDTRDLCT